MQMSLAFSQPTSKAWNSMDYAILLGTIVRWQEGNAPAAIQ